MADNHIIVREFPANTLHIVPTFVPAHLRYYDMLGIVTALSTEQNRALVQVYGPYYGPPRSLFVGWALRRKNEKTGG